MDKSIPTLPAPACEYCGRDDMVLYAWHADAWCVDCMRQDYRWHDGLTDDALLGRPDNASYDEPFVYQTPDGRVQEGVVHDGSTHPTLPGL